MDMQLSQIKEDSSEIILVDTAIQIYNAYIINFVAHITVQKVQSNLFVTVGQYFDFDRVKSLGLY